MNILPVLPSERPELREPSVTEILDLVCRECRVELNEILSQRRSRRVARPRQLAYWLARETTALSFPQIGSAMSDRDHTTILHGCRKIDELRQSNSSTLALSDRLLSILRADPRQPRLNA